MQRVPVKRSEGGLVAVLSSPPFPAQPQADRVCVSSLSAASASAPTSAAARTTARSRRPATACASACNRTAPATA
jgi:hypothetical protein